MITACFDDCSVRQLNSESWLSSCPVIEHFGLDVSAVFPSKDRPINLVSRSEISKRLGSAIRHKDRGMTRLAIKACMSASSKSVDRPAEPVAVAGNVIEDGFRLHLVEIDAQGLRCIEGADDPAAADSRQLSVLRVDSLPVPAHEQMFANRSDGLPRERAAERSVRGAAKRRRGRRRASGARRTDRRILRPGGAPSSGDSEGNNPGEERSRGASRDR
jgi:hypothetical protein